MLIEDLFARHPDRFGYRGDPHLWDAMREHLRGQPVPGFVRSIEGIVEKAFAELVGAELPARPEPEDAIGVRALATGSGMSDGMVSAHFWRYIALTILIDRAAAAAAPSA